MAISRAPDKLRWYDKLKRVSTWQLVLLFMLFAFVSATLLKLNNVGMSERRLAVVSADKVGDSDVIQKRLYDLQNYVSSHMNTQPNNVELVEKYKRDVAAIVERINQSNKASDSVFKKVDNICKARYYGYSQSYVQCMNEELAKIPEAESPITKIELPNPAPYRFNFVSPLWSADFAGLSVLVTWVLAIIIIIKLITRLILGIMLKRQYRRI